MNVLKLDNEINGSIQPVPVSDPACAEKPTLLERLHYALGPLAAGIIIDIVDFAMFGPIGLALGPVVGGLAGWWVSSLYGFGTRGRLIVAIAAAIYVTVPFTELLPLATMVAAVGRFYQSPAPVEPQQEQRQPPVNGPETPVESHEERA
jgi:hypothetical protein